VAFLYVEKSAPVFSRRISRIPANPSTGGFADFDDAAAPGIDPGLRAISANRAAISLGVRTKSATLALIALLAPVLYLFGEPVSLLPGFVRPDGATPSLVEALHWLLGANVSLVIFNLIPAFPLDGGRMLRGLLGLVMEWPQATRWATTTGQTLAMGMGTWGVVGGQLTLVIIAVMIFFAASATDADERAHAVLSTQRVGDACTRHAITLGEADRVSTVIRYLLTSYQPDFAVLRGPRLLGVVRRAQVVGALAHRAGDLPVTAIMADCATVSADGSLADTRRLLEESRASVAAVLHDGDFVGLVSAEDIAEAETVLAFVRAGSPGRPTRGALRPSHAPAEA